MMALVKQVKEWKKNNKYLWTAWLDGTNTNTMIASESQSTSDTPPDFEQLHQWFKYQN